MAVAQRLRGHQAASFFPYRHGTDRRFLWHLVNHFCMLWRIRAVCASNRNQHPAAGPQKKAPSSCKGGAHWTAQFLYSVPDSVSVTRSKYFHCPVHLSTYRVRDVVGTAKIPKPIHGTTWSKRQGRIHWRNVGRREGKM